MNCFETGHFKRECRNTRKEWLDYVDGFMLDTKLPDEYFGNWSRMVGDWRAKNQEKHEMNKSEQRKRDDWLEQQRSERCETVGEISRILLQQKKDSYERQVDSQKEQETVESIENKLYERDVVLKWEKNLVSDETH